MQITVTDDEGSFLNIAITVLSVDIWTGILFKGIDL